MKCAFADDGTTHKYGSDVEIQWSGARRGEGQLHFGREKRTDKEEMTA
jgi:hypothetical protein